MDHPYPPGPAGVPDRFTEATASYKLKAWTAMAGLGLFLGLYLYLSGWFAWQAWRLLSGAIQGGGGAVPVMVGIGCVFLAVFMLKALVFVKRGGTPDGLEITAEEEPRLFAFLHRLADEAGAPRPHRVFLSPRVNASVSYDLSVLNLLWPSRKNLEIGLPLVNVLNLGELKAVLAHEFGHFGQRSMAVGRWVYVAQQIAGHIVAKRDALDRFLDGLSRIDIRFAWIGWILSLIVWAIRSLLETAFRLVVLAQRALSREMEMQADRVAVSLTGSDALVNALYRLRAADEAWDRTLDFADEELKRGRCIRDLLAVQARVIGHLRVVLDEPAYGQEPVIPEERPEAHRIFTAELAQPPAMWATHPLSHQREENAKRIYLPAVVDGRSPWVLFADPARTAERVTAHLSAKVSAKAPPAPMETTLGALDDKFRAEYLDRAYRGIYLGRSAVRAEARARELVGPAEDLCPEALEALYPESLVGGMDRLRALSKEKAMLEALQRGTLTAPDGGIRHRGATLRRRDLPGAIALVQRELGEVDGRLRAHDKRCRSLHRAAAASLGGGWAAYLEGLAALLHYADHTEANLRDVHRAFLAVLARETATGKVSRAGVTEILAWAVSLYEALAAVHHHRGSVRPDAAVLGRMGVESWSAALGEFRLGSPRRENFNDWVKVIDGWVQAAVRAVAGLRDAALGQLLHAEARVSEAYRAGLVLEEAPAAPTVPAEYGTLLPGRERELPRRFDWWIRFQTADGAVATVTRLAAAAAIIGVVLGVGGSAGRVPLTVYNGLDRPVVVTMGGMRAEVAPMGHAELELEARRRYRVETRTAQGSLIEAFPVDLDGSLARCVYDVASAAPMVAWTATYGNQGPVPERRLGAVRWQRTDAEFIFEAPPASVSTSGGGATRTVLSAPADGDPGIALSLVEGPAQQAALVRAHARWDRADSPGILEWLALASREPGFQALLGERLQEDPGDVPALRAEYDHAPEADKAKVAARHRELAARQPDRPDLQYIAARSLPTRAQRDQAFLDGARRFPGHPWFSLVAGHIRAEREEWTAALPILEATWRRLPPMSDSAALDIARIRRISGGRPLDDLAADSRAVRSMTALESGAGVSGPLTAYAALGRGALDEALAKAGRELAVKDRILRLIAASDGARAAWADQALAMAPDRGLDGGTAWVMLGLALRRKADAGVYRVKFLEANGEDGPALAAFADALAAGGSPEEALRRLGPVSAASRGQAYGLGVVLLGSRAPRAWREGARRLLFVPERPYFAP